jgi:pimeloyl-ACP methyl ester carboxylesterase
MNKKAFLFALFFLFFGTAGIVRAEEGFRKTSDGVKIFYDLRRVENEKGAVILLHGWDMSAKEWAALVPFLNQNGWTTLAVDLRGHGASTQYEKGGGIQSPGMTAQNRKNIFLDIEAVKPFVRDAPEVWLIGSSFGAAAAFKYSLENSWIHGVVLLSPAIHYRAKQTLLGDMEKYGERPVFFAASKKDKLAYETAKKMKSEARGKSQFKKYRGEAHGSALFNRDRGLKKDIVKWMERY